MSHPFWHSQWRYEKHSPTYPEGHSQELPHLPANGVVASRLAPHPRRSELLARNAPGTRAARGNPALSGTRVKIRRSRRWRNHEFSAILPAMRRRRRPAICYDEDLRGMPRALTRLKNLIALVPRRSAAPCSLHAHSRHFPINSHNFFV